MLVASYFMYKNELQRKMNKEFKRLKYGLKEKRFVIHQVLGYTPYLSELTIQEMEKIIKHLETLEPVSAS